MTGVALGGRRAERVSPGAKHLKKTYPRSLNRPHTRLVLPRAKGSRLELGS